MSIRASEYARATLETDPPIGTTPRLVLMLLAERANSRTGQTYTGGWLVNAAGVHPGNVRRALRELETHGLITVRHRPGKASVVGFPVVGMLSTPRAETRGVDESDPARTHHGPRAAARVTARGDARRTWSVPVMYPEPVSACVVDGCACDSSGWIHVPAEKGRGHVTPCPNRTDAPKEATG